MFKQRETIRKKTVSSVFIFSKELRLYSGVALC